MLPQIRNAAFSGGRMAARAWDRREEGGDGVVAALLHHDVQVAREELHLIEGLRRHVDRITRRAIGQPRDKLRLRRLRHRRQIQPVVGRHVGHQDAATAGDGDDAEPVARRKPPPVAA